MGMEQYYKNQLDCLCSRVKPADRQSMEAARRHWNGIAKPIDGLGRMEELIIRIAGICRSEEISLDRKAVVVFCADNGVVAEGVTQTGSEVTAVVADNIARGTASVNRMALVAGADVIPVDMGVAGMLTEPGIRSCKIAPGTGNIRREPAMTMEQALEAVHTGIALAGELADAGYHLLAVGEMGIGNTTTASAVSSVLLGCPPEAATGRGAGLSGEGLERKIQVVKDAVRLHNPDPRQPMEVLAALGGFDLAAMTGLLLGGAVYRIPVVLDGMISAAAALLAKALCPAAADYMLPSHLGKEPVCAMAMERLGFSPVIHGRLALGEGTGAVMLFPLLDMAAAVYEENSTFADIQIDAYEDFSRK